jgi:hypothetical protein
MKRKLSFSIVLLMAALAWTVGAGENKAAPPIQVELNLVDGSHLTGSPDIETLVVQTAYARMDVPLNKILSIRMAEDRKTATVDFRNGDKVKDVVNLGPFKLETAYGKMAVNMAQVKEINVLLAGESALPDALKEGLVLYYPFNRDEGEAVVDESGKKHNGAAKNAKWTARGKRGGGCEFSGNESYLDAGTSPDWDFDASKGWSLLFWVYPCGRLNEMCFFCRPGDNDSLQGGENYLYYQSHSQPEGLSWGAINGEWDSGVTLALDKWQQIALVYDPAARQASIYVDGELKASIAGSVGRSSGPLYIGDNVNINFLNGRLDEFMIYSRALSADEIKKMYDAQK